jgi:site-specific recombinase XerD
MEYLKNKNFSSYTVDRYVGEVKYFLLFVDKEDVKYLTKEDILNYRKELHDYGKYKHKSLKGIIFSIFRFFDYLLKHGYISENPFDSLDLRNIINDSHDEERNNQDEI